MRVPGHCGIRVISQTSEIIHLDTTVLYTIPYPFYRVL